MTNENTHRSFADLGERICDGWGSPGSLDELIKRADDAKQAKFVLVYLATEQAKFLKALQPIADLLSKAFRFSYLDEYQRWRSALHDAFVSQLEEKENLHGQCPDALRKYFRKDFNADASMRMDAFIRGGGIHAWIRPPQNGSPLRKEYNAWMKRKAPKETSVDDED